MVSLYRNSGQSTDVQSSFACVLNKKPTQQELRNLRTISGALHKAMSEKTGAFALASFGDVPGCSSMSQEGSTFVHPRCMALARPWHPSR